ncbi:hypothetical protein AVEN_83673-1 [Araneus ventricosus]|uniref:Uncharacterized protein n=1 Tax=Araneus ventricosus TaxID=182803 RepID=A0A4Y2EV68_ARAVE|nr:hypothetical protein AVEN_83673-1 [Araneus ventricosus]
MLARWQATFSTENCHIAGQGALVWMMFLCCPAPPPRSPDLTPSDFSLWGYVKDKVYVPPVSTTLQALQERITAAVTDIDGNKLLNVWTELHYRWDVCRVTKGTHMEHL